MRLSVWKDDPGYGTVAQLKNCKVLYDGEDVTFRCTTADEEEGKVWLNKHNDEGKSYLDHETGEVASEVLTGKVEILLGARTA